MSDLMADRANFKGRVTWSPSLALSIENCSLDKIDWALAQKCVGSTGIQMIGDSITRYQYLNLVHFLATKSWLSDPSQPNENERKFAGWNDFYAITNQRMMGHEICDCYREPSKTWIENRYFVMGKIQITYRQMFHKDYPIMAHDPWLLNLTSCNTRCQQAFCIPGGCDADTAIDLGTAIQPGVLSKIINSHPAREVFINAGGHWDSKTIGDTPGRNIVADYAEHFRREIEQIKGPPRVHWKMTTANHWNMVPETAFVDSMIETGHFSSVFDTRALTDVLMESGRADEVLWDDAHYNPPVYVGLNQALLAYLCTLPP